jgi:PAP2 superfamily
MNLGKPPHMQTLQKLIYLIYGLTIFLFYSDTQAQTENNSESNTASDSCAPFRIRETILPVALLAYGSSKPIVSAIGRLDRDLRDQIAIRHPSFTYRADDWLQWAPSASVYAMDAAGVRLKHRFGEHLLLDAGSIIITGGAGFVMRKVSEQIKGFEIVDTQFPSGHTSNAFRGAEMIRQEMSGRHPLLQWSGYLVAGLVAGSRLMRGEHHLSEVVAGAGLGILSTKITYGLFHGIKRSKTGIRNR